jgi:hypothetical protein
MLWQKMGGNRALTWFLPCLTVGDSAQAVGGADGQHAAGGHAPWARGADMLEIGLGPGRPPNGCGRGSSG